LILAALPASAAAGAQTPPGPAGAARVILVGNTTGEAIDYTVRETGPGKASSRVRLQPDKYHVWRDAEEIIARHGEPEVETRLRPGALYEFRRTGEGRPTLVRLPLQPETAAPADPEKERRPKEDIESLQRELTESRERERAARALLGLTAAPPVGPRAPAAPGADADALTVLTWPAGAEVYLSAPSEQHPGTRTCLGTAPVRCRLSPGTYEVLLMAPGAGGRWAAPGGVPGSFAAGGKDVPCVTFRVEKAKDSAALVRALRLAPAGSMADRLARATEGAPGLYPVPDFDAFLLFAARALARADVALSDADARKLHDVMRRCGFLRYEVEGGALDLEFHPGAREAFTCKEVRPAR
jgi:hypothetical protein